MASPVTLRVDQATKHRIARIARQRGITASDAMREAILAWADHNESQQTPYHALADLIGCVRGGNPARSQGTGAAFTRLLRARRPAGR